MNGLRAKLRRTRSRDFSSQTSLLPATLPPPGCNGGSSRTGLPPLRDWLVRHFAACSHDQALRIMKTTQGSIAPQGISQNSVPCRSKKVDATPTGWEMIMTTGHSDGLQRQRVRNGLTFWRIHKCSGATNPYTNSINDLQKYFRLISN
jgi:hypothetical protein